MNLSFDENAIAKVFAAKMLNVLGKKTMIAVNKENNKRKNDTCATQDHCDANMVMVDAMEAFGLSMPNIEDDKINDPLQEQFCSIWNAAWNLAKKNNFFLDKTESPTTVKVSFFHPENPKYNYAMTFPSFSDYQAWASDHLDSYVPTLGPSKKVPDNRGIEYGYFIVETK